LAHTRRLLHRHGLPFLTLIFFGVSPFFASAQEPDTTATASEPAPIVIDMATPLEAERPPPPPPEPSALGVYRNYIQSMEASAGAFAPGLTEQLLGLGLNLQALNRHEEAEAVLKRGVHVSRVQSGLYAADQIPLLRAEIRSLTALGRFEEVDERQRYLARVESEALEGTPASIAAFLDQGAWAEQAWELRLGEQETHPEHLARSWEYYRLAYNQSSQLYGEQSLALVKPLEGMLRLQYHFASMQRDSASHNSLDNNYRQTTSLGGVYRRGEAVLTNIYAVKRFNGSSAGEQASDLAKLGDWAWWMGRKSHAYNYYEQAWNRITPPPAPEPDVDTTADGSAEAEGTAPPAGDGEQTRLAAAEETPETDGPDSTETANAAADTPPAEPAPVDDPVMRAALFETSTPLPDIDSLRPLPPFSRDDTGPIVVQFRVDELGKVKDLERLTIADEPESASDASEEGDSDKSDLASAEVVASNVERLFRKMRRTRFRPRYEAGAPVETDTVIWSFALDPFGSNSMELQPQ
jgi:hypothetical protein